MKRTGVGIIGCGNVLSAYWPEIQQIQLRGEIDVLAACDLPAKREMAVDKLGIPRFEADYKNLLAMPDVELVVILTSIPTHFEIAKAALQAGKHVLSEKPMGTTLAEAAELVELAHRGPGIYVPAPFTILSPTFRTIAERIHNGDIGKVCSARGRYGWSGPWWHEWFYRPGGGPLFDLACYNITTLTGWLGPAEHVMAMTGTAVPERMVNGKPVPVKVEDNAHVLIDFGGACFATVTSGYVMQQYRTPPLELYGTTGTIQMMGDDWDPDGYEMWQNDAGCWRVYKDADPNWSWTDGFRHLVECVRQGTKPLVAPEHAYHVLEIMLQAQASGRDGQAKKIESRFAPPEFHADAGEAAHLIHDRTRKEFVGDK